MYFNVNGERSFAYTGGKPLNPTQPTIVFIHGVLNDHSVWILQTRYLAHHGWNVLAVDLPGHCKSGGDAPESVAQAARFVIDLLDAAAVAQAVLVGHSWGSLIALEVAATAPARVQQLAMIGAAFPMKVSPTLLDGSLQQPQKAIDLVNVFSHSTLAPPPSALGPGTWLYGGSRALMRRVLASNPRVNLFHRGFTACDNYTDGLGRMSSVQCPVLFVLGQQDQMTPPKAAQALIAATTDGRTVLIRAGHQMMTERSDDVLQALLHFLRPNIPA